MSNLQGRLAALRARQQAQKTRPRGKSYFTRKEVWDQICNHAPELGAAMLRHKEFFKDCKTIVVITEEGEFRYEMGCDRVRPDEPRREETEGGVR